MHIVVCTYVCRQLGKSIQATWTGPEGDLRREVFNSKVTCSEHQCTGLLQITGNISPLVDCHAESLANTLYEEARVAQYE